MDIDKRKKNSILLAWDELPDFMKKEEVRPYWEMLNNKRGQLRLKRVCDIVLSISMIFLLLVPMIIIAIIVKTDSSGSVFFRQVRVTQYGREFKIIKFRTMYDKKNDSGSLVTIANDQRITKVGKVLRKYRLDEIPQLFNVLVGDMSFVGTRPEVPKYVKKYENEWLATLLLPAGITSECSIRYKDEEIYFKTIKDVDIYYENYILPTKMKINLISIICYNFFTELWILLRTIYSLF